MTKEEQLIFNLNEELRVATELLRDMVEAINHNDNEGLVMFKEDAEVFLDDYKDEDINQVMINLLHGIKCYSTSFTITGTDYLNMEITQIKEINEDEQKRG